MATRQAPPRTSSIEFHRGKVLQKLANTYGTVMMTIVECIQNAIDADATRVFVGINFSGRQRTIVVADDGFGATQQKFEEALATVGHTIKATDKLGQFGLGLISPLTKCASFTFTSCPKETDVPLEWTFEQERILRMREEVTIPLKRLGQMSPITHPFVDEAAECGVRWRTIVKFNGVVKDRSIALIDIDELESQILTGLGNRMRVTGAKVRVVICPESGRKIVRDVTPMQYLGDKLDVLQYEQDDCGLVQFELYRAPTFKGQRKGEVVVMQYDDDYAINWRDFANQARASREWYALVEDAFKVLGSGYFEGTIRCKNIQLAPERRKFMFNDALTGLYEAIDYWFNDAGKAEFENEEEVTRGRRYQELGLKSLGKFQELSAQPSISRLFESLKNVVTFGTLGRRHAEPASGKPGSQQEERSLRVQPTGPSGERQPTGRTHSATGTGAERKDRPSDTPLAAIGPVGRRRQTVKHDSIGLQYSYETLDGTSRLWEFDFEFGVLFFNIRHPIWVQLDETNGKRTTKNDKWIMHLQEWLTLQVLQLVVLFPDVEDFALHRELIDTQTKNYCEMFIIR